MSAGHAGVALAVLRTNVLMILIGGTTTLWLQQLAKRRADAQGD